MGWCCLSLWAGTRSGTSCVRDTRFFCSGSVYTLIHPGSSVALVAGSQFEIGEKMGVQNTPAKRAIRALTSPLPSPNVACPRVILGDAVVTHYKNPINK